MYFHLALTGQFVSCHFMYWLIEIGFQRSCVRSIHRILFAEFSRYLVVEMLDSQMYGELLKHVIKVNAFIRDAIDGGGAVLVHGTIGATRSACLVMAYCMDELGMESK